MREALGTKWGMCAVLLCAASTGGIERSARSQGLKRSPVTWKAASSEARPGAAFAVRLTGAIDPGWHIYALDEPDGGPIETTIGVAAGDPADLLHVDEEQPQSVMDPAFGQRTTRFETKAKFILHLRLFPKAVAGTENLHILVRYQSCNDRVCLPPHTDTILAPVLVGGAAASGSTSSR